MNLLSLILCLQLLAFEFTPYYRVLVYNSDSRLNSSDNDCCVYIVERLYFSENIFRDCAYSFQGSNDTLINRRVYPPDFRQETLSNTMYKMNIAYADTFKVEKENWYLSRHGKWYLFHSKKAFMEKRVLGIPWVDDCTFEICPDSYKVYEKYRFPQRVERINNKDIYVYNEKSRLANLPGDDLTNRFPNVIKDVLIYFDPEIGSIREVTQPLVYQTKNGLESYSYPIFPQFDFGNFPNLPHNESDSIAKLNYFFTGYEDLKLKYQIKYEDTSYNQKFMRNFRR